METVTIIGGILAAGASGLGLGAGLRLIPTALQANRDLRRWKATPEAQIERRIAAQAESQFKLAKPAGRKRDSAIVGLYEDALRLADGSYARVYDFPLQATMLADDYIRDRRCDDLGGLLTAEMPPGTVVQFRYAVGPDPGRAIAEHLNARLLAHLHAGVSASRSEGGLLQSLRRPVGLSSREGVRYGHGASQARGR